jgi:hypothetical protein
MPCSLPAHDLFTVVIGIKLGKGGILGKTEQHTHVYIIHTVNDVTEKVISYAMFLFGSYTYIRMMIYHKLTIIMLVNSYRHQIQATP